MKAKPGSFVLRAMMAEGARNCYIARHGRSSAPIKMGAAPNETNSATCGGVHDNNRQEDHGQKQILR
jgi:hypothetical protein